MNFRAVPSPSPCKIKSLLILTTIAAIFASPLLAQSQQPIPATKAFDAPAACNDQQLGGLEVNIAGIGIQHVPSPLRGNPEWKVITLDPKSPPNLQPPVVLEGFVTP